MENQTLYLSIIFYYSSFIAAAALYVAFTVVKETKQAT